MTKLTKILIVLVSHNDIDLLVYRRHAHQLLNPIHGSEKDDITTMTEEILTLWIMDFVLMRQIPKMTIHDYRLRLGLQLLQLPLLIVLNMICVDRMAWDSFLKRSNSRATIGLPLPAFPLFLR